MNAITDTPARSDMNGIPVEAVRELIAAMTADAAVGQTRWRVANVWQGGTRSRAQVEGFEMGGQDVARPFRMEVDEPFQLGGSNHYANPQEYLLAGLNACMTVGFTALCALHGIELEHLEIATEGEIDLRGFLGVDSSVAPGYERLQTTFKVRGSASPEEFQRIFETTLATSPNFHNITRPIAVTPKLVVM